MPIAAITGGTEVMDAPGVGGLGGTRAGNPVACAVALAVLDRAEKQNRDARAQLRASASLKKATAEQRQWPIIGASDGLGAMRALELVRDRETQAPAAGETKAIVRYCYERGVLIPAAGTSGNLIRLWMTQGIRDEQFDEAIFVLHDAILSVPAGLPSPAAAR
jgi:4-aminobutyrate aminotransferase / (S)-3-amino-2-methylpropionate transaminase / 5-aminovalerate transaminase